MSDYPRDTVVSPPSHYFTDSPPEHAKEARMAPVGSPPVEVAERRADAERKTATATTGQIEATVTVSLPFGPRDIQTAADAAWTLATTLGTPEGMVTAKDAQMVRPLGPLVIEVGDYRFTWPSGAPRSLPAVGHPDGRCVVTKRCVAPADDLQAHLQ